MIDFHTHTKHNPSSSVPSVYNLMPGDESYPYPCSVGLHPWHIGDDWEERMQAVGHLAEADNVVMIGETGIDKVRSSAPLALQEEVFLRHVALSERLGKPLVIHCVKAYDDILRLKQVVSPRQQWIVHGFRGKPQQAEQLLRHGFKLSFGEHFNPDSLRLAAEKRAAWLETDESTLSIEDIYKKAVESIAIKSFLLPLPNLLDKIKSKIVTNIKYEKQ